MPDPTALCDSEQTALPSPAADAAVPNDACCISAPWLADGMLDITDLLNVCLTQVGRVQAKWQQTETSGDSVAVAAARLQCSRRLLRLMQAMTDNFASVERKFLDRCGSDKEELLAMLLAIRKEKQEQAPESQSSTQPLQSGEHVQKDPPAHELLTGSQKKRVTKTELNTQSNDAVSKKENEVKNKTLSASEDVTDHLSQELNEELSCQNKLTTENDEAFENVSEVEDLEPADDSTIDKPTVRSRTPRKGKVTKEVEPEPRLMRSRLRPCVAIPSKSESDEEITDKRRSSRNKSRTDPNSEVAIESDPEQIVRRAARGTRNNAKKQSKPNVQTDSGDDEGTSNNESQVDNILDVNINDHKENLDAEKINNTEMENEKCITDSKKSLIVSGSADVVDNASTENNSSVEDGDSENSNSQHMKNSILNISGTADDNEVKEKKRKRNSISDEQENKTKTKKSKSGLDSIDDDELHSRLRTRTRAKHKSDESECDADTESDAEDLKAKKKSPRKSKKKKALKNKTSASDDSDVNDKRRRPSKRAPKVSVDNLDSDKEYKKKAKNKKRAKKDKYADLDSDEFEKRKKAYQQREREKRDALRGTTTEESSSDGSGGHHSEALAQGPAPQEDVSASGDDSDVNTNAAIAAASHVLALEQMDDIDEMSSFDQIVANGETINKKTTRELECENLNEGPDDSLAVEMQENISENDDISRPNSVVNSSVSDGEGSGNDGEAAPESKKNLSNSTNRVVKKVTLVTHSDDKAKLKKNSSSSNEVIKKEMLHSDSEEDKRKLLKKSYNSSNDVAKKEILDSDSDEDKPKLLKKSYNSSNDVAKKEILDSDTDDDKPKREKKSNSSDEVATKEILDSDNEVDRPEREMKSSNSAKAMAKKDILVSDSDNDQTKSSDSRNESAMNEILASESDSEKPKSKKKSSDSRNESTKNKLLASDSVGAKPKSKKKSSESRNESAKNEILASDSDSEKPKSKKKSSESRNESAKNEILASDSDSDKPKSKKKSNLSSEAARGDLSSDSDNFLGFGGFNFEKVCTIAD